MGKQHSPKHGSLAYLPRKRAKKIKARIRYWPKTSSKSPVLLAFSGYKAGMTYVYAIEDKKRSPNFGKEVMYAATVLETPPMLICGIRVYQKNLYGLVAFSEIWMKDPPTDFSRLLTLPKRIDQEEAFIKIKTNIDTITNVRILATTQPKLTSLSKKKPDIQEIEIGGGRITEQIEYAKQLLGKTVTAEEVFKEGQYVDVAAITTGKGFQGPVKRWGVAILQHKGRKTKRGVATLGPWKPTHVRYSVPRAGQMGYHQRIEFNKRILKIGKDGKEVSVNGGFIRYGQVKGSYIIIKGSVAGTEKRLVRLRQPARPPSGLPKTAPQITYVSLESPQGK
jgi:large subunit ribosomal protein L3